MTTRHSRFLGAALALLTGALVATSASADGSRASRGAYAPPIWTGLYVGAHLGYASVDATATATAPGVTASAFASDNDGVGGLQIGYNWQSGQMVFGVEADIDVLSDMNLGSLRGRLGIAQGNMLIYGTAGIGFGDVLRDSSNAFVIGAGVEFDMGRQWRGMTLGVEGLYYAFEEEKGTLVVPGVGTASYTADADVFVVRGRLNYKLY
jgi:outer membrane immunogenic protein